MALSSGEIQKGNAFVTDEDGRQVVVGPGGLPVVVGSGTLAGDGRKVVTTAGTRVALAATTTASWVTITAETDNTGIVVVGGASTVVAALATRRGTPLNAGDAITLPITDLADVGLDSTVNGDGVTYIYGA